MVTIKEMIARANAKERVEKRAKLMQVIAACDEACLYLGKGEKDVKRYLTDVGRTLSKVLLEEE